MRYELAIFDFDGTLADSFPFFLSVHNLIAKKHGFKTIQEYEVPDLRHRSPREIMQLAGLPRWKLPWVAKSFIALMHDRAAEIRPFDGIHEALERLQREGVALALVTSNSVENVRRILGPKTFARLAHFECGASLFGKKSRLQRTLRRVGVAGNKAIYIGDQMVDAEAARCAGIAFGAVAWGYGSLESLAAYAPEVTFTHVAQIEQLARE
jgi:phosphoglycolate phosphatase